MSDLFLELLVERFTVLEAELNALDAATGDGDHGTTMLKGVRAAKAASEMPGKAFRREAGGASGSLFSVLVAALDQVVRGAVPLQDALTSSAEKIHTLGQAVAGDKTMLDALIPATKALTASDAAEFARQGCEATVAMQAKRGRAKHVEGAGVGYCDAGATSVAEMLTVFAAHQSQTKV